MKLARTLAPLFALSLIGAPALADASDAMMRAGFDANALAAAGVVSGDVSGIVADVAAYLGEHPADLSAADASYVAAKQEVDMLRRLVQAGTASAQDVSDLAAAKSELATAEAARSAALDAIYTAGAANLTTDEKTALAAIRANRSWTLPIEFLVESRTDAEWVALRDALAAEKVALGEGVSVDEGCASLLLAERAKTAVAAAKTAHDSNSATVLSAWQSAVSQG